MSAEIKEKEVKRKWGMEMSDSLKPLLNSLCYVVFDSRISYELSKFTEGLLPSVSV